ncbi:MAG: hypothetical protein KKA19_01865, partial [Candidatus Margulisbacteria bacterium]|nr:hypothetical protein [Candidatus Margulisiibacteriota bacterium]
DYRAPTNPFIEINNGAEFSTLNVSILVNATDDVQVTQMFVSGDVINSAGTITVNTWISANIIASQSFVVALDPNTYGTNTDGERTIAVKFRDALSNESNWATDNIILFVFTTEGRPVISKFFIESTVRSQQPLYTSRDAVAVYLDGYDVEGSTIIAAMKIYGDDMRTESPLTKNAWILYEHAPAAKVYLDNSVEGRKILYARFMDQDFMPSATALEVQEVLDNINNQSVTEGILGKLSTPVTTSIIYDVSKPIIYDLLNTPEILYASYYFSREGGRLKGSWKATDTYSGIARYQYRIMEVTSNESGAIPMEVQGWTAVPESSINRFENNAVEITSNIELNPEYEGYYFEVKAYDGAGNYQIASTNMMGVDKEIPSEPTYNYYENIVLNRPVFDIDFPDNLSGIYRVEYSIGNPNAKRYVIQSISSNNIEVDANGNPITGNYVQEYMNNWNIEDAQWQSLLEGSNSLYFKIIDAAGNVSYPGVNFNKFTFIKDTLSPEGVIRFNNGNTHTSQLDTTCNINFANVDDFNLIYLTRWPVTMNQFIEDYSFENSGDNNKALPNWQLDQENEQVTMSVKLCQSFENVAPQDGIYALFVSFNANLTNSLINWSGLTYSINTPTGNVTYNITGFINFAGFTQGGGSSGGLNEEGPYFQVEVENLNGDKVTSDPLYQSSGIYPADTTGWLPFFANIKANNNDTLKITIKLKEIATDNTSPFRGYFALDGISAFPGGDLYVTKNRVANFPYRVQDGVDGPRKIFSQARDNAGNWKRSEGSIYLDTTAPTWSGQYVEQGVTGDNGIILLPINGANGYQGLLGRLQAYWHADDLGGSGVSYYQYRVERRTPTADTSAWEPYYPLPSSTSNYYNITGTTITYYIPMHRNAAYRFAMRAVDKLGHISQVAYSNEVIVDVDLPVSNHRVTPGIIVTLPGGITQNSGWYKDGPISVTISAYDHSKILEATTDVPTINGSGVATINYITGYVLNGITYLDPTQSVTIVTINQVVTFNLTRAGQNIFAYWTQDAIGWTEGKHWVTQDLHIDKEAPLVTTNLHIYSYPNCSRWWNAANLPIEFTMDDQMRSGVEYLPAAMLRHRYDRLGDGTSKLYYRVDDNPSSNMVMDAREIGSATPWPVPPTINPGSIVGWSNVLSPYIEPFTIRSADGTLPPLAGEGIHIVYYWAEDKFAHFATVNYVDDIRIDNGKPLLSVNLGGSFQTAWCTNPLGVIAQLEAVDQYATPVSLNIEWFTVEQQAYKPSGYVWGEKYTAPGSGVKYIWYQINNDPAVTINADPVENRFSLKPSPIGIFRNGYNTFTYKLEDNASNKNTIFFDTPAWDWDLRSWVTAADEGVIRYIKLDNEPPYNGELYLDKYDIDPLYTNSRLVSANLIAKDDGKGVMYAYLSGYD